MITQKPKPKWKLRDEHPGAASLAQGLNIPLWAAQALCLRGHEDAPKSREFLNPNLSMLPTPEGLGGLGEALKVLLPAITSGRTIGVAGDYDADGVTATALMVDFLQSLGAPVVWDIPHRIEDGYGFGPHIAERLAAAGAKVVVTVDSGVSDHQGVQRARDLGMAVVVTDHHRLPPGPMVPAQAVIDPQQEGCSFPPELAGVGVAFYLAAGIRAALRAKGFFKGKKEPNLLNYLDLVAIGTCADIVPLTGCNRVLVSEGLKVMNRLRRPGLAALAKEAKASGPLDSQGLSFSLAPRINAPGRLGHASAALKLLLCGDPAESTGLARDLDRFNARRKDMELEIFEQALDMLAKDRQQAGEPFVVMASRQWHRGVLGIVASRVVEKTGRPAMLFSIENGMAYGSGRSIKGFNLHKALVSQKQLLHAFGGHALAAGASLPTADLKKLKAGLAQYAKGKGHEPGQSGSCLEIESVVGLGDLGGGSMRVLQKMEPFGEANPEPRLRVDKAEVVRAREVGQGHLKMDLGQEGRVISSVWFNHAHMAPETGALIDLACRPHISNFRGRRIELFIDDIRPSSLDSGR